MPKKKNKTEPNSLYFIKILLYFLLGMIWIKVDGKTVFPIGLVIGILLSMHEHFQIDRKVEYAILLIATLLGYVGLGIFLSVGTG